MITHGDPISKADSVHLDVASSLNCLPCMLDGWSSVPATIQHVTEGFHRLPDQHRQAYPSCPWHHQGHIRWDTWTVEDMTTRYGPSFAHGRKPFEERYGDERHLIQITQALVRMQISAMKRGEYIENAELMKLAKQVHFELVA